MAGNANVADLGESASAPSPVSRPPRTRRTRKSNYVMRELSPQGASSTITRSSLKQIEDFHIRSKQWEFAKRAWFLSTTRVTPRAFREIFFSNCGVADGDARPRQGRAYQATAKIIRPKQGSARRVEYLPSNTSETYRPRISVIGSQVFLISTLVHR